MNVLITLCKREWQEHRGAFGWSPVVVFGLLVVITLIALIMGSSSHFDSHSVEVDSQGNRHERVIEERHSGLRALINHMTSQRSWSDTELGRHLKQIRTGVAEIFAIVYFLVVFFTLLGALYEDRRDRTVLFWKSIPASDTETVLSKLITAVWVAPVVTIAMILITQLFLFIVASALVLGNEDVRVWSIWSQSGWLLGAVELVVGYAVQGFWSLPLWGWLLLVSAFATRLPFIWAVFTPAMPVLAEWLLFDTRHLLHGIANHMHARALPIASGGRRDEIGRTPAELSDMFALLATTDMWIGIAIGALFIYGAIYFRRRNNEI